MSRSKRKPYATCGYGGLTRKFYKRYSNKKIRQYKGEISDGMSFKKYGCDSWDICDYKYHVIDLEMQKKFSRK